MTETLPHNHNLQLTQEALARLTAFDDTLRSSAMSTRDPNLLAEAVQGAIMHHVGRAILVEGPGAETYQLATASLAAGAYRSRRRGGDNLVDGPVPSIVTNCIIKSPLLNRQETETVLRLVSESTQRYGTGVDSKDVARYMTEAALMQADSASGPDQTALKFALLAFAAGAEVTPGLPGSAEADTHFRQFTQDLTQP